MWNEKFFKTESEAKKWIEKHSNKYQMDLIFVNNGVVVEYKKLRIL